MSERPAFHGFEALTERYGAAASECHGLLAGALVSGARPEAAAETAAPSCPGIAVPTLAAAATDLSRVLAARQFAFQPWLPDDGEALEARVTALAAWVRGFVSGLGEAGARLRDGDADTREMLADLETIARGAAVTEAGSEAEEAAFAELVEYLRLAVQNLYEELNHPG